LEVVVAHFLAIIPALACSDRRAQVRLSPGRD